VRHAETLLFVQDQQSEVGQIHIRGQEPVRADENVHLPARCGLDDRLLLFRRNEAAEHGHVEGKTLQPAAKVLIMLLRKHCRRAEQGNLSPLHGSAKGGTHGHLGLAEADIAAHEPVHGLGALHVRQHVLNGARLVRRLLEPERGLEFAVVFVQGTVGIPLGDFTIGVHLDQIMRDALHGLAHAVPGAQPAHTAQPVQGRLRPLRALVALDETQPVNRQVELVIAGKAQQQIIIGRARYVQPLQTEETSQTVVAVYEQIAGRELVAGVQAAKGLVARGRLASARLKHILAKDQHLVPVQVEAFMERRNQGEQALRVRLIDRVKMQPFHLDQLQKFLAPGLGVKAQDGLAARAIPKAEQLGQGLPGSVPAQAFQVATVAREQIVEAGNRRLRQFHAILLHAHDQVVEGDGPVVAQRLRDFGTFMEEKRFRPRIFRFVVILAAAQQLLPGPLRFFEHGIHVRMPIRSSRGRNQLDR